MLKEIFDRVLAALGLIVAAPLIVLLGLLIKIESSGPVFFKHLRVGKNGRLFRMYKFRKMPHDLDVGPKISPKHDPRLTRVGKVMDRLKFDEIPQLFNILKGDMSFVGPRPEIPEIVNLYTREQRKVLSVKPGLVGPNQIVWRNEKNLLPENLNDVEAYYIKHILPEKLARDLCYVEKANFFLDLKYFLLGFGATIVEPLKPVHFVRRKREILHLTVDLGLCLLAFVAALLIKYDLHMSGSLLRQVLHVLPIFLFWQMTAFVFLDVYQQVWKYFSQSDLVVIIKAVSFATLLTAAIIYPLGQLNFPVTVLILNALLCVSFLGGTRLMRSYLERNTSSTKERTRKKILIYGANAEGELLVRRILADLEPCGCPIGFLDGDPKRRGSKIHGLEVLGDAYDLPLLKELHGIEEVYVASNENVNGDLQRLLDLCDKLQVKCKFVATTFTTEKIWLSDFVASEAYPDFDAGVVATE
ncbi:MAG: sugar transferase [candidate division KSB1 bacterium]|nr:sugar transferase [candidate division KSB1 bacterium]MDZ7301680.1 sugar transferase [candidate division KSB1 bacterium]